MLCLNEPKRKALSPNGFAPEGADALSGVDLRARNAQGAARSADAVSSMSAKRMRGLKRENVAKVKVGTSDWRISE
jgi:hypothetical protein